MQTILLIGAGATRAEALARRAGRRQRPPLDADFFELAEKHAAPGDIATVRKYVDNEYGIDVCRHPRPGMEYVFGLIYSRTVPVDVPRAARAAFTSLCRLYATVIAETTNWIEPTTRGPLSRLIRASAKQGTTSIITFNQDLVVEKALQVSLDRQGKGPWYPDDGYEMVFSSYTTPTRGQGELFQLAEESRKTKIPVLKPHGSLNWYAKTSRQDRVLSQLRAGQTIYCTRRVKVPTQMTYTTNTASGRGRKTWYTWPLIVPPIAEKGRFLSQALEGVWSRAWDSLLEADRLVIYGYSFPEADFQTRSFFLRIAASRDKPLALATINPDLGSAERAHRLLNPSIHLVSSNVRSFLSRERSLG